jgi:hypothetical protein
MGVPYKALPASVAGVCEVEVVRGAAAAPEAGPDALFECAHGATRASDFDGLRGALRGSYGDGLRDFFFVNTDVGSAELARAAACALVAAQPARFLPPAVEMPDHAVFVSYAREDLPAVQRLKAALDRAGITVWFDMERLEGGDDYDRKIQRNIGRCAYFVPVVSANTERRIEAYFRREWSYAIDRTRNMEEGAVYILPVCIDDTVEVTARVPDKFKAAHFTRLPAGEGGDAFASRLRRLFSGDA